MKRLNFIIIFKALCWCSVGRSPEPEENHLNGSLLRLLNFAAARLTDDGSVSQSPKYCFKSIFYWIKRLEYCTLELFSGKWLGWCSLFALSLDLSQRVRLISSLFSLGDWTGFVHSAPTLFSYFPCLLMALVSSHLSFQKECDFWSRTCWFLRLWSCSSSSFSLSWRQRGSPTLPVRVHRCILLYRYWNSGQLKLVKAFWGVVTGHSAVTCVFGAVTCSGCWSVRAGGVILDSEPAAWLGPSRCFLRYVINISFSPRAWKVSLACHFAALA